MNRSKLIKNKFSSILHKADLASAQYCFFYYSKEHSLLIQFVLFFFYSFFPVFHHISGLVLVFFEQEAFQHSQQQNHHRHQSIFFFLVGFLDLHNQLIPQSDMRFMTPLIHNYPLECNLLTLLESFQTCHYQLLNYFFYVCFFSIFSQLMLP